MKRRNVLEGFIFKLADDAERAAALELRSRIYSAELGSPGLDRFDAGAHHVVGLEATGAVIASVRIIGAELRPFDIESLFNLETIVPLDRNPAEISRFCIDPRHRQMSRDHMLHFGMLKAVYDLATKLDITDIITLGLPHLKNLYRVGYFAEVGEPCLHPTWGPAQPMRLDLIELRRRHAGSANAVARLLLSGRHPNVRV